MEEVSELTSQNQIHNSETRREGGKEGRKDRSTFEFFICRLPPEPRPTEYSHIGGEVEAAGGRGHSIS